MMATKSSTKKSLRRLFSRSEASVKESVEKEEKEEEEKEKKRSDGGEKKKKFKLFKFSRKAKSNTALERTARSSESTMPSDSEEVRLEDSSSATSRSFYATAPRSKAKDLSFSELDLRKPRRFGTFSFGLRKKKREKDGDGLSRSATGLQYGAGTHHSHQHMDLSQWELDPVKRPGALAASQPELDTAEAFDIPSPPPVASPLSASRLAASRLSASRLAASGLSASQRSASDAFLSRTAPPTLHDRQGRLRSLETLLDSPDAFDVDKEMGTAPIAAIPELLLLTAPPTPDFCQQWRRDPPPTGSEENQDQVRLLQIPVGPDPPETGAASAVGGPLAIPGGGASPGSRTAPADSSPLPFEQESASAALPPVVLIKKLKMNSDLPAAVAVAVGDLPDGGGDALAMPTLPAAAGSEVDAAAAVVKTLLDDRSQINPVHASTPLPQDVVSVPRFQEFPGGPGSGDGDGGGPPSADKATGSEETYQSVFSQSFTTEVFSAMSEPYGPPAPDRVLEEDPDQRGLAATPPPACDQHRLPDSLPHVHSGAAGFPHSPVEPGVSERSPSAAAAASNAAVSTPDPDDDDDAYRTPTDAMSNPDPDDDAYRTPTDAMSNPDPDDDPYRTPTDAMSNPDPDDDAYRTPTDAMSNPDPDDEAYRTPTDAYGDGDGDGDVTPTNEDPRTESEYQQHLLTTLYDSLLPLSHRHQTDPTAAPRPPADRQLASRGTTSSTVLSGPGEPAGPDSLRRSAGPHSAVKPEALDPVANTEASVSPIAQPAPPCRGFASSPETADTHTHTHTHTLASLVGVGAAGDNLVTNPELILPPPLDAMAALKHQQERLETMAAAAVAKEEEEEEEEEEETFTEPVYISVGSDGSSAADVYFSAEEDNLDEVSTVTETDDDLWAEAEDMYDAAVAADPFFGAARFPPLPATAASGPQGSAGTLLTRRIDCVEGRRLRTTAEGRGSPPPPPAPPPLVYSHPLPPLPHQERGATGATGYWSKRRIDMWGERLDKQEEEEEEEEEMAEEELPALPVQQVETVKECDPAPPSSQVCNEEEEGEGGEEGEEEEEEEVGENWKRLILPVTVHRSDIPSEAPDLLGRGNLSHKGFCRTEPPHRQHLLLRDAHTHTHTHTFPEVSAALGTSRGDAVERGEKEETEEEETEEVKADLQEKTSERSPPPSNNSSRADATRTKSPLILARYTPVNSNLRTGGADTTSSSSPTSTSSFTSSSFFGASAEPSDASQRVGERTSVGQSGEAASDGSGLESLAASGVRLPPAQRLIAPQG
ncbi:unnamed protein product [Merluccius merluccius]